MEPLLEPAAFSGLVDLASERLGGSALLASDEFFAEKENLLKPGRGVFIADRYTDRGKWMDGWESRRKRNYAESSRLYPDFDSCIIRLGLSGTIRGFVVDTAHFKGNYPKACAIEGASIEGHPDVSVLLSSDVRWTEILPRSELAGDSKNRFEVAAPRATALRGLQVRAQPPPAARDARWRANPAAAPIDPPRKYPSMGDKIGLRGENATLPRVRRPAPGVPPG